jgi:putative copper export protein
LFSEIVHVAHVSLAGVWLGGVVFTTAVVSPALKAMKWSEAERVGVRSALGRQYARVGSANLALLLLFAILDGTLSGFGALFYAEYSSLLLLFGLVAVHGAYFGRHLARLAGAEREARTDQAARSFAEQRRSLQRLSLRVSQMNLLVSVVVMVLAAIA